jgi:hypothetical protein
MDEFTAEDLETYTATVHPIELLGKRAYIRGLTLDGQEAIAKKFNQRDIEQETTAADLRFLLACVLCDSKGNLIFSDFEKGAQALNRLDHDDLLGLIESYNAANGQDIEAEKKPSETIQSVR